MFLRPHRAPSQAQRASAEALPVPPTSRITDATPAASPPIPGTRAAAKVGEVTGALVGTSVAIDTVVASAEARQHLPQFVNAHVVPLFQKGTLLTRPLRHAGQWTGQALAKLHPALAFGVYAPAKAADCTALAFGMLADGIPWQNSRALLLRAPFADYPAGCDFEQLPPLAAEICPDPQGYVRAAELTPFYFGAAAVVLGIVAGRTLAPRLWTRSAPVITLLPTAFVDQLVPPYLQGPAHRLLDHAERTEAALAERAERRLAAAQAQAQAAAGTGAAASQPSTATVPAGTPDGDAEESLEDVFEDAFEHYPLTLQADEQTPLLPRDR